MDQIADEDEDQEKFNEFFSSNKDNENDQRKSPEEFGY